MFRKISAKSQIFENVRNNHEIVYNNFVKFAESLSFNQGITKKKSGKATSYARYLIRLVIFYEEIFENKIIKLDTYTALHQLEEVERLPDFKEYNQSEGRFPSAALGCFKAYIVAEHMNQEEITDSELNRNLNEWAAVNSKYLLIREGEDLVKGPKKRATPVKSKAGMSYPRNIAESIEAKRKSEYKCEIDLLHETFINSTDNNPYVEAHHLVPMAAQGYFENTIDFADNIVTLCPNCHRKIHYALPKEKAEMLEFLYANREKVYSRYRIEVDKKMLMNFYGIIKADSNSL